MLLKIDLESERPIYLQIRDQVVAAIARGELAEGERLPSIRQLAADLGVNVHTVHRAYDLLRQQGFLRVRGRGGAVVRRPASSGEPGEFPAEWERRARRLLEEARARGLTRARILARLGELMDA
ncbi:MAG: GntR family transcriptional regulator [Firmicutes bacterium]|nr:GntR family transcriptional regulator [Bacillota bacterium]